MKGAPPLITPTPKPAGSSTITEHRIAGSLLTEGLAILKRGASRKCVRWRRDNASNGHIRVRRLKFSREIR